MPASRLIKDDVDYKTLAPHLAFLRKYLNDSRYPFDHTVYTYEFYNECLESILAIQQAIDSANDKKSTADLLKEKFGKHNVIDKSTSK